MAAAFDVEAHVSDLMKCPICLEDYKFPKSLPCLHTFCRDCLQSCCRDKLPGDELLCPSCRNTCHIPQEGISAFPVNFFLNDLLCVHNKAKPETDETLLCQTCQETREGETTDVPSATKYCVDCSENVCDKCSRAHTRMKTGGHLVISLGEEMSAELMQLHKRHCQEHKDRIVEIYCYNCNTNICSLCSTFNHKQHDVAEISEAADKLGKDIDTQVNAVSDCITDIHSLRQQWDEQKQKLLAEIEKLEATVKQRGKEKKKLIDDHVDNLLQELQSIKLNYSKEIECNKERLETTAVAMQSYINFTRVVRSKGNSSDITHGAEELCTRATMLLQTGVLSKSVETPDIVFVPVDDEDINLVGRWACKKFTDDCDGGEISVKNDHEASDAAVEDELSVKSDDEESDADQPPQQPSSTDVQAPAKTPPTKFNEIQSWLGVIAAAVLDKKLYLLMKSPPTFNVYDAVSFSSLGTITIPGFDTGSTRVDITACSFYRCLYIADAPKRKIIRLEMPSKHEKWPVEDINRDSVISVTSSHDLLVLCGESNKLKLFDSDGVLRSTIAFEPGHVTCALESTTPGQFLVTQGRDWDPLHRVCIVNSEGKILRAYGGFKGSYMLNNPSGVAVDKDGFVYVDDEANDRLVVLTSALEFIQSLPSVFPKSESSFRRRMKMDDLKHVYVSYLQYVWNGRVNVEHYHLTVFNSV